MFALESILTNSKTKFAVLVTIVVTLSACASNRKMIDEGEARVIPQSALAPGESWGDTDEPMTSYASTKENFRSRVKKSAIKSRKSQVASRK